MGVSAEGGSKMQRAASATRLVPSLSQVSERYASWLGRNTLNPAALAASSSSARKFSAAPPPPAEPAAQESFLSGSSGSYVEDMYEAWAHDPSSVHASWDAYFRGGAYQAPPSLGNTTHPNEIALASLGGALPGMSGGAPSAEIIDAHLAVQGTIRSYQVRGHLAAQIDPLGLNNMEREKAKKMIIRSVTVDQKDMETVFQLPKTTFIGGKETALPLKEIINRLENVYCRSIGAEYMHINNLDQINWIRQRLESPGAMELNNTEKRLLLARISRSVGFEGFLAKKWASEKRFGLEGVDMLIPCMKQVIDRSTELGVECVVMGMPHRGRLNVLANVCRKPLEHLLTQFNAGLEAADEGSGDVKYHLGTYIERLNRATNKNIRLSVVANPSHLEAVNPIVEGKVRAEQFYRGDTEGKKAMSVLLHGDAAFAGQGVVYETMGMSELPDYSTKGTIHIVANNQIGFTTDPRHSRASPYCTDVGRVVNAPIFHVDADDPDAVVFVSKVASEFRQTFHTDVVIDLIGYRKHGHNEIDEPMFTQPLMYQVIKKHKNVFEMYSEKLVQDGVVSDTDVQELVAQYEKICEDALEKSKQETKLEFRHWLDSPWKGFFQDDRGTWVGEKLPETGVSKETLARIAECVSSPGDVAL